MKIDVNGVQITLTEDQLNKIREQDSCAQPKKITTNCLWGCEQKRERRSGNTTRLVDNAIQILFNNQICIVEDHWTSTNNTINSYLLNIIINRLKNEHPNVKYKYEPMGIYYRIELI